MNGPGPILVELAELMVELVPHADWCLFGKNGTDATTSCVTLAQGRERGGARCWWRAELITAPCHGAHRPWLA